MEKRDLSALAELALSLWLLFLLLFLFWPILVIVVVTVRAIVSVVSAFAGGIAFPPRWVLAFLATSFGPAFGFVVPSPMAVMALDCVMVPLLPIHCEGFFQAGLGLALFDDAPVIFIGYESDYLIWHDRCACGVSLLCLFCF